MPNDYFDDVRTLLRNRYQQNAPHITERFDVRTHSEKCKKITRKLRNIARNAKRYNG